MLAQIGTQTLASRHMPMGWPLIAPRSCGTEPHGKPSRVCPSLRGR
jgi:hypothetical protein